MRKLLAIAVLLLTLVAFGSSAVLAAAPTWSLVSVDAIGCAVNGTQFTLELAGVTDPSPYYWRTIVDAGGNRYMDENAGNPGGTDNGSYSWSLYNSSSAGPVTAVFPLPNDTPITVQLLLTDGLGGPAVSGAVVTFDKCNGGSVTSIVPIQPTAGACADPLPTNAVIHSLPQGAPAFYAADLATATNFSIPAGTWYVTQTSGDFTQLWIACQANRVWVPSNAVAP
ncbi:MAG: hypothetical protein J0M07_28775 [Anaerolineae bacterium]|nr:hypothetical protein [Anaerolineae bacterium]